MQSHEERVVKSKMDETQTTTLHVHVKKGERPTAMDVKYPTPKTRLDIRIVADKLMETMNNVYITGSYDVLDNAFDEDGNSVFSVPASFLTD